MTEVALHRRDGVIMAKCSAGGGHRAPSDEIQQCARCGATVCAGSCRAKEVECEHGNEGVWCTDCVRKCSDCKAVMCLDEFDGWARECRNCAARKASVAA